MSKMCRFLATLYLIWHDSWWVITSLRLFHKENEYDQKCKQQNDRVGQAGLYQRNGFVTFFKSNEVVAINTQL